jgi:MOSC domain-containing protein YiiM
MRVPVRKLNLGGDPEADLTVHGGEQKAVYCYPSEHYGYSKRELPGRELPMAVFGENLTTEGLLEDSAHLGDRFALGSAEFIVTQPRLQTGYSISERRHGEAIPRERPYRFLLRGDAGGASRRRR